jgi:hypothetical protein
MSKKEKNKDVVTEEPMIEEVVTEEPIVEEPKPKEKKEKPIVHKIDGRMLGTSVIEKIIKREINGRDYNEVYTLDGQIFLLNDTDLENQVSK